MPNPLGSIASTKLSICYQNKELLTWPQIIAYGTVSYSGLLMKDKTLACNEIFGPGT